MAKKLTVHWLEEHHACGPSLAEFRRLFGWECRITTANVLKWIKTVRGTTDLYWLVKILIGTLGFGLEPFAHRLASYLHVDPNPWLLDDVTRAVIRLPDQRLAEAIVQIADQSSRI